ncbi:MAG: Rieske (2Fe-2S) protein [Gammaproteobacteria bacterium]
MKNEEVMLCARNDLEEGDTRSFSVSVRGDRINLFLVLSDGVVYAYENSCPHTGGPLDWVQDQFLNLDGDRIQCATHDAQFGIEDGVCVLGPCLGDQLRALETTVRGGLIWLRTDSIPRYDER